MENQSINAKSTSSQKTIKKEFAGGSIYFTPHGTFKDNSGKDIEYDDSVKVEYNKRVVKLSENAISALIQVFTTDEEAIKFIKSVPKPEVILPKQL